MRLERVVIQEFRKFQAPLVLDGLTAGLNIFVGPNEAGKSTIAMAIRAAFLERYKTGLVTDFAPAGSSGARPAVELVFSHGGKQYLLRKSFLNRARCELIIDGGAQRLDGDEADNALAAMLGYELSGRGQSKPELGGIPGLLWIQQGQAQDLQEAAGHAGAHLREALTRLSGELASTDGDRLHERVAQERAGLLDARGGRPKGAYKAAEDALLQAGQIHAELSRDKAQLDADVDRLAALRQDYERAGREQPWRKMDEALAQARNRLQAIAAQQERLAGLRRELEQAQAALGWLQEQVSRDQHDQAALQALQSQVQAAVAAQAQLAAELVRCDQAQQQAQADLAQAQRRMAQVQAGAERQDLDEQIARLQRECARLDREYAQAAELTGRLQDLQTRAVRTELAMADLQAQRALERALSDLQMQQQAIATRLHYRLEAGQTVALDGRALQGAGEALLTAAAELRLPGLGVLSIVPGGRDLPALLTELEGARAARDAMLRKLGLDSLAQAEERYAVHQQILSEQKGARELLAIHAPQGLDALQATRAESAERQVQLQERRNALGLPEPGASEPDAPAVRQVLQSAQTQAQHAAAVWHSAQTAWDAQAARAQVLQEQLDVRQAEQSAPERIRQRSARAGQLVQALAMRDDLARRTEAAVAELEAQHPALLEQDVQRFENSARIAREEQQRRHEALLQLQGKLEQAGVQGLGERLAQAQAELARLQRRRDDYALRAQALDLLHRLLDEQRLAATQRLQAPLARRLNHYLALLFPGAQLRLDQNLLPSGLRRADSESALQALSFGTREQLGILARFAYADLLRESGRPTLLLLDDALVHADTGRRDLMKRALFDAASRHQILMFSCHAEDWTDMGAAYRQIPG